LPGELATDLDRIARSDDPRARLGLDSGAAPAAVSEAAGTAAARWASWANDPRRSARERDAARQVRTAYEWMWQGAQDEADGPCPPRGRHGRRRRARLADLERAWPGERGPRPAPPRGPRGARGTPARGGGALARGGHDRGDRGRGEARQDESAQPAGGAARAAARRARGGHHRPRAGLVRRDPARG